MVYIGHYTSYDLATSMGQNETDAAKLWLNLKQVPEIAAQNLFEQLLGGEITLPAKQFAFKIQELNTQRL